MTACPECGAPLGAASSCMEHFHALLALEGEIPGGPGEIAHFFAVASYGVQHPGAMGYTVATVGGLRAALARVLGGEATIADTRRQVGYAARSAGRVTRRTGDPVPIWPAARWTLTVLDGLAGGADGYGPAVERWARSVVDAVAGTEPTAETTRGAGTSV